MHRESVSPTRPTERCGNTSCEPGPLGPIRTLADAPMARDAVGRVALHLNREATQQWRDLIDLTRTPVIGCANRLAPQRGLPLAGGLTTMQVRVRDLPREVPSLHSRVERYLKRHSPRLDPFETCQACGGPRRDPNRSRGCVFPQRCRDRDRPHSTHPHARSHTGGERRAAGSFS